VCGGRRVGREEVGQGGGGGVPREKEIAQRTCSSTVPHLYSSTGTQIEMRRK